MKLNKRNLKSNKAITLIALVITVIVLLILAGVTIATLTGDNGLLQKATTAKQANEEASALEKIQVEVAGSYGLDGKIDIAQLNINLKRIINLKYKNSSLSDSNKIEEFPVTVELDNNSYQITNDGTVIPIKPQPIGNLTKDNYGDYLDLGKNIVGIDSTTDDWRIIYNDKNGKKVYAILTEFLPNGNGVASSAGLNTNTGNSRVAWANNCNALVSAYKSTKWKEELISSDLQNNSKIAVEGGITIENLMKSYNEKHKTNLDYSSKPMLYLDPYDETKGIDTLYMPHYAYWKETGKSYYGAWGCWLSTETPNDGVVSPSLGIGGDIHGDSLGSAPFGIMPVAIMDSDIKVTSNEIDGKTVWRIIE